MNNKITLTMIVLLFTIVLSKAQTIPNASFENWTNKGTYENPNFWATANDYFGPMGVTTCEKGTPGATGNFYLKVTNKKLQGNNVFAIAASSTKDLFSDFSIGGFACSVRPQNLTLKYQCSITNKDTAIIAVYFSKWNSSLERSIVIAQDFLFINSTVKSSWTSLSIPINFMIGDYPDSALILISAGQNEDHKNVEEGNYIYVDDMKFVGTSTGIVSANKSEFNVYPNPATSNITISFENQQNNIQVRIIELTGKEVSNERFTGVELQVETSTLKRGIYLLEITDNKKSISRSKFILE